ncbi:hypothetical protein B0H21DRAFT_826213 [Amylocystis lapponica]|nr:hypothetical protein B0H21DRAFT_826213 [Amylocystis lapponica]
MFIPGVLMTKETSRQIEGSTGTGHPPIFGQAINRILYGGLQGLEQMNVMYYLMPVVAQQESAHVFLDVEATVEDEEEEENELEDDEDESAFIEPASLYLDDAQQDYTRLLSRVDAESFSREVEEIAQRFVSKYATWTSARQAAEDIHTILDQLLLPTLKDPAIWALRVKPGKEMQAWSTLLESLEDTVGKQSLIKSVLLPPHTPEHVYLEATDPSAMHAAMFRIRHLLASSEPHLVLLEERVQLLHVKMDLDAHFCWVRVLRGRYRGDLAFHDGFDDHGKLRLVEA